MFREETASRVIMMKWRAVLVLLTFAANANVVQATALAAINATRASLCLRDSSTRPLVETSLLDRAADQLARGRSLHEVLYALPERPAFAAAVRLPATSGDAAIEHAAAARFCRDLSEPGLQEIGIAHHGDNLWVIVTQPFAGAQPQSHHREELDVLRVVNAARARGRRCGSTAYAPVEPVRLSDALSAVALEHSTQMAAADSLAHEGRDGSTAAMRVHRANIPAKHVGENIAAGVPTGAEVIAGWLASPSHCSVIMDPRFTEMGVSYAAQPHSRSVMFWTQLFSEPR